MAKTKVKGGLRKCIGSARFGIEPHEAPVSDFPAQPSQKDGLGRMCAVHWRAYTAGLARDAKARKAGVETSTVAVAASEPKPTQEPRAKSTKRAKAARPAKPDIDPEPADLAAAGDGGTTDPDPGVAEQDAILVERKSRVKSWRRQEAEKALAGS